MEFLAFLDAFVDEDEGDVLKQKRLFLEVVGHGFPLEIDGGK